MASGSRAEAAAGQPKLDVVLRDVFSQRGNHSDVVYNNNGNDGSKLTIKGAIEAHLNVVGTGALIAGLWSQTKVTQALRAPPWNCGGGQGNVHGGGCSNLYVLNEVISQEQARCQNPRACCRLLLTTGPGLRAGCTPVSFYCLLSCLLLRWLHARMGALLRRERGSARLLAQQEAFEATVLRLLANPDNSEMITETQLTYALRQSDATRSLTSAQASRMPTLPRMTLVVCCA